MKTHVPDKIVNAIKQGFSGPDKSWFKGESMIFIKDQLLNKKAKIYKYLDRASVKKLINEHLMGKKK